MTLALVAAVIMSVALMLPFASAEAMTTSDAGITFIKDLEGFRSTVYYDSGSAFIGYGTSCRSGDYPDGITKEKADELLREVLLEKESYVNKVFAKYGVSLTQNQFDAVMSFTYNLGTAWMNSGTRFYNYLIDGAHNYTDIQIVNAIGTWCHQGKSVNGHLVERRLDEARMFLYSDYDGSDPHEYRYLTFDAGEGDVENSIVFFEYGKPYGLIQPAQRGGYTFTGWKNDSGVTITASSIVQSNGAVTAVWVAGIQLPEQPVTDRTYSDVVAGSWYFTYVKDLSRSNVIGGYPDGTFKPDNTITGGEALKLILRAVGFEEQVPVDKHWASGYLKLAVSKGILSDGEITNLDKPISRLQIARITAKSIGLPPLDPEATFSDTTDGHVLALYRCGIVTGNNESGILRYLPEDTMTRAEISAVVWRIGNSDVLPY